MQFNSEIPFMKASMEKLSILETQVDKNNSAINQLQGDMIQMILSWQGSILENILLDERHIMNRGVERCVPVMANREFS